MQYFANTTLTPPATASGIEPNVNYPSGWTNGSPATGVGPANWTGQWTGQVLTPFSAYYTFYVTSDGGSNLVVNYQNPVNTWSATGQTTGSGTIYLMGGVYYNIQLQYIEATDPESCVLSWSCPFFAKQPIPQSQLFSGSPVATPVISFTGSGPQVTISTATAGASIYYTTNGKSPTTSSSLYAAPFAYAMGTTIKAVAISPGYANSAVASAALLLTTTSGCVVSYHGCFLHLKRQAFRLQLRSLRRTHKAAR